MKLCKSCNQPLQDGDKVCLNCGALVEPEPLAELEAPPQPAPAKETADPSTWFQPWTATAGQQTPQIDTGQSMGDVKDVSSAPYEQAAAQAAAAIPTAPVEQYQPTDQPPAPPVANTVAANDPAGSVDSASLPYQEPAQPIVPATEPPPDSPPADAMLAQIGLPASDQTSGNYQLASEIEEPAIEPAQPVEPESSGLLKAIVAIVLALAASLGVIWPLAAVGCGLASIFLASSVYRKRKVMAIVAAVLVLLAIAGSFFIWLMSYIYK